MPLGFPVVQEEARHALVCHFPVNDAVSVDLLDDGLCHKKAGTYTGCLAHNMHNWPQRSTLRWKAKESCESCRKEQS